MITLLTGTPGAGKTLYAVAELLPQYEGRPLFVDGIPDLVTPHELPAGQIETTITKTSAESKAEHYAEWLPENGVLVVDECQRIWRPRAAGSKVPPGVEAMETHRHHGHDLLLITQHPNLLDGNVRRLIGRHLHVRRVWGMNRALVYEWDQATDPNRGSTATKKSWRYPKSAFGLYKSATIHTNRGQRPPILMWLIFILPVLFLGLSYFAYNKIVARTKPITPETVVGAADAPAADAPTTERPYVPQAFIPVDPMVPASAPAYDEVRQITDTPRIIGCISTKDRCTCYTQQATPHYLPFDQCRSMSLNARFDPFAPKPMQDKKLATLAPIGAPGQTGITPSGPSNEPATWGEQVKTF